MNVGRPLVDEHHNPDSMVRAGDLDFVSPTPKSRRVSRPSSFGKASFFPRELEQVQRTESLGEESQRLPVAPKGITIPCRV